MKIVADMTSYELLHYKEQFVRAFVRTRPFYIVTIFFLASFSLFRAVISLSFASKRDILFGCNGNSIAMNVFLGIAWDIPFAIVRAAFGRFLLAQIYMVQESVQLVYDSLEKGKDCPLTHIDYLAIHQQLRRHFNHGNTFNFYLVWVLLNVICNVVYLLLASTQSSWTWSHSAFLQLDLAGCTLLITVYLMEIVGRINHLGGKKLLQLVATQHWVDSNRDIEKDVKLTPGTKVNLALEEMILEEKIVNGQSAVELPRLAANGSEKLSSGNSDELRRLALMGVIHSNPLGCDVLGVRLTHSQMRLEALAALLSFFVPWFRALAQTSADQ